MRYRLPRRTSLGRALLVVIMALPGVPIAGLVGLLVLVTSDQGAVHLGPAT